MPEDISLIEKIKKDLEKSGFGSEMLAIRTFLRRGWECSGGPSFVDRDQNQSREFDILAHQYAIHPQAHRFICVFTDVAAEVKKSERPWVVFRHAPNSEEDLYHGWTEVLNYSKNLPGSSLMYGDILDDWSLTNRQGWKGYAVHESFKNPDQPSRWYAAAVAACKAAHHQLDINYSDADNDGTGSSEEHPPIAHFVQPLVILDGLLFVAEISDSGELLVAQATMASVDFPFSSAAYEAETYRMPLVTLEALPEYLELIEQRANAFLATILEAAGILAEF
ncbi:MAG TPA: hypothetical protein VEY93_02145 [Longimicrobium sp.]|nr:hypothetical protein [Longimicrobium sp.]